MNISGKTFIVTGASSGIGEVLSKKLAKKGAQIICASRNLDKLNRVVDEIKIQGGTAISVQTDITQVDQCQLLVEKTINRFGKLDALVLNAGISMWTPFESLKDVGFFSPINGNKLYGCRSLLPRSPASFKIIQRVNCELFNRPSINGVSQSLRLCRF